MTDPITHQREIVEAATPGAWREGQHGTVLADRMRIAVLDWPSEYAAPNSALIVASSRLARAVADPAFVEKITEWLDWNHDLTEEGRTSKGLVEDTIFFLATHALREEQP